MASFSAKKRTHCIRCGECCQGSSPTLQRADVPKVLDGVIPWRDLYTLRPGEPVRDNVRAELKPLDQELIKLRETDQGACIYYDEENKACRIYEHRPVQCAAQKCWDDREFIYVYARRKAARRDLIGDPSLLRVVDAHDMKCSIIELEKWIQRIHSEGEEAVTHVLSMLQFDYGLRRIMPEKLGFAPNEIDLVLGRALIQIIEPFGLKVIREADGTFLLTVRESPGDWAH